MSTGVEKKYDMASSSLEVAVTSGAFQLAVCIILKLSSLWSWRSLAFLGVSCGRQPCEAFNLTLIHL